MHPYAPFWEIRSLGWRYFKEYRRLFKYFDYKDSKAFWGCHSI